MPPDLAVQHQAVAWLFLAAFSQVYSENQEQKAEQKDLKNLQFDQKSLCKVGIKEVIVSAEITISGIDQLSPITGSRL
jgi:hypothetical protein